MKRFLAFILSTLLLTSCGVVETTPFPVTATFSLTPAPTETITPLPSSTATPSATPDLRLSPDRWQEWPVVPTTLSSRTLEIFQLGQELGNDPRAFSKIGDGEISTAWFFASYDLGPDYYDLGDYSDLQSVIDYFSGSFGRTCMSARRGFNTQMVLDPAFANPEFCTAGETPMDCELRLHHPAFAIISMGTNQVWDPQAFESGLRAILERLIETGVVPILSTKGDNLEGDYGINRIIASLAYEYDLPLWNFWRIIQPLPEHGMQADHEHLTYDGNSYLFTGDQKTAWPWRNLTALQVLQAVSQGTGLLP